MPDPSSLLSPISRIPHGVCLTWDPLLVWTLAASHLLVGLAYLAIPLALIIFIRRQPGLRFNWMFALFGAFILACGMTHFISLVNIWRPHYGLEALVMAITAVVSVATAASLLRLIPIASRFIDEKAAAEQKHLTLNATLKEQTVRFFDLAVSQRESRAELMAVQDASPIGLFRTNAAGECIYVNRTFENICGRASHTVLGNGWIGITHPQDLHRVASEWQQAIEQGASFSSRYRLRKPEGSVVWISAKGAPVKIDAQVIGYIGSIEDVTALHDVELALKNKQEALAVITDALPIEISFIDRGECLRFANRALEIRLGQGRNQLEGQPLKMLLDSSEYEQLAAPLARAFRGETVVFEQQHADQRSTESTLIPALAEDTPEVIGVHAMTQDITHRKREEVRLRALSVTDPLTGMGNRAGFEKALRGAIDRRRRNPRLGGIAVLFADLDNLKQLNDSLGHAIGDALLQGFAERLQQGVRATDYCARYGGDEFTVVLENIRSFEDVTLISEKLMAQIQQPFFIEGKPQRMTASFGVACHLDDSAPDAEALVRQADAMLYAAKRAGRNTYRVLPLG